MVWWWIPALIKAVAGAGKVAAVVGKAGAAVGKVAAVAGKAAGSAALKGAAVAGKGAVKGAIKGASVVGKAGAATGKGVAAGAKGAAKGVLKGAKGTKQFGKGLYQGAAPKQMGGMTVKGAKTAKLAGAQKAGFWTGKIGSKMQAMGGGGGGGGDPVHTPAREAVHTPGQPGGLLQPGQLDFQQQAPIQLEQPPVQQFDAPLPAQAPIGGVPPPQPTTEEQRKQRGTAGKYAENQEKTSKAGIALDMIAGNKEDAQIEIMNEELLRDTEEKIKTGMSETDQLQGATGGEVGLQGAGGFPKGQQQVTQADTGKFNIQGQTGKGWQEGKPGVPVDPGKGPGGWTQAATFLGRFLMGGAPSGVQSALDMIDPVVRHKRKVKEVDARRNNIVERADLIIDKFSRTKDEKGFEKEVKEFVKNPENVDAFTHNLPELYDADDVAEYLYLASESGYTLKEALLMGKRYGSLSTAPTQQGLQPAQTGQEVLRGAPTEQAPTGEAPSGQAGVGDGMVLAKDAGKIQEGDITIPVVGVGDMVLRKNVADTMKVWELKGDKEGPPNNGKWINIALNSTVSQAKDLKIDLGALVSNKILKDNEFMVAVKGGPQYEIVHKGRSERREFFADRKKDFPKESKSTTWIRWLQKGDTLKFMHTKDVSAVIDQATGDQQKINWKTVKKELKPKTKWVITENFRGQKSQIGYTSYYDPKTKKMVYLKPFNPKDVQITDELQAEGVYRIDLHQVPQEEQAFEFVNEDLLDFYDVERYSTKMERGGKKRGRKPKGQLKAPKGSDKVSEWTSGVGE